jgi:hypothetical protein
MTGQFVTFGFFSGTFLRARRLVPIFYSKSLPAGARQKYRYAKVTTKIAK